MNFLLEVLLDLLITENLFGVHLEIVTSQIIPLPIVGQFEYKMM